MKMRVNMLERKQPFVCAPGSEVVIRIAPTPDDQYRIVAASPTHLKIARPSGGKPTFSTVIMFQCAATRRGHAYDLISVLIETNCDSLLGCETVRACPYKGLGHPVGCDVYGDVLVARFAPKRGAMWLDQPLTMRYE
jgi:hypothetical protein